MKRCQSRLSAFVVLVSIFGGVGVNPVQRVEITVIFKIMTTDVRYDKEKLIARHLERLEEGHNAARHQPAAGRVRESVARPPELWN